ncbi:MAG: hypothetical protein WCA08_11200 [Desulfoferrobacter sp.]
MFAHQEIITQPIFILFIGFSFALTLGYFWGKRKNHKIIVSAFQDLVAVVEPEDHNFTNIGGAIGYHANLICKKGSPFSQVDATITLLPRHSWLYLPISKMIKKYDRLFITLYFDRPLSEEAHLIEARHAGLGQRKIRNAQRLKKEELKWGKYNFFLYYNSSKTHDAFTGFTQKNPEPGIIRHIALVPDQKKGFIFLIPEKGKVRECFARIYEWLPSLGKDNESGRNAKQRRS